MRRTSALWLLGCLCACHAAAPVPVQVPPQLERYADACAFVPDGMVSFAFLDARWLVREDGTRPTGLVVIAGRDFQRPAILGLGFFAGVAVHDAGTNADASTLLSAHEAASGVGSGMIDGCEYFHVPGKDYSQPLWYTFVDQRFLVRASAPEILAQALQRRGSLTNILAPFAPLPSIADKTVCTIWNLPRDAAKEPHADVFSVPVPDQPTVSVFSAEPWLLQIMARGPLPECYRRRVLYPIERELTGTGPWRGFESRVWEIGSPESLLWFMGQCWVLFGVPLAI